MSVDPRFAVALAQLDAAVGTLESVDPYNHAELVPRAVAGLSAFYLHTRVDGRIDDGPIYADPGVHVMGHLPGAVAPLLDFLWSITQRFDRELADGLPIPAEERLEWEHWKARLRIYRNKWFEVVEAIANDPSTSTSVGKVPSEELFRWVTAPLLQGYYPDGADWPGIVNPKVKSPPDVVAPVSIIFAVHYFVSLVPQWVLTVSRWRDEWRADLQAFADGVRAFLRRGLTKLADAGGTALKAVVLVGAAVGLGFWVWAAVRGEQQAKEARRR